ncbi:MAG: tetratricopeptide repeat protein [Thermoleophilia bacterium]|jgi:tetratricopeptide (TPR) repeat protein
MKNNLKWLLLIPAAVLVAVVMIIFIPRIFSSDSGSSGNGDDSSKPKQGQASEQEITDIQKRIDAATELIAANPADAEAIKELGTSYYDLGTVQSGGEDYNASLRSFKSAIEQFRKYLSLRPQDPEVRTDLGLAYVDMGLIDLGVRELETATVTAPTNQRAWHSFGWALSQEGKVPEAREAWQKSYSLNPTSTIGQESKSFLDQTAQNQSLGSQSP